mgnify:CR=1 FL=1
MHKQIQTSSNKFRASGDRNIFVILQKAKDKAMFVTLGDGTLGLLPEQWLQKQLRLSQLSTKI